MTTPLEEAKQILERYFAGGRGYPQLALSQLAHIVAKADEDDWSTARANSVMSEQREKIERLENKIRELRGLISERDGHIDELEAANSIPSDAEQASDESMQPADPVAPDDTSGLPQETIERLHREGAEEALTSALHPEFGTEWREPDGVIYKAIQQAKREGAQEFWNRATGHFNEVMNAWPFADRNFQIHTRIINGDYVITQNTPGKQEILATCPYPKYANHVAAALREYGPLT